MLRRSILLATLTLALALLPAQAFASDASSTHAYIQANYALARASVGLFGTTQAKIEHLNSTLAHECPLAGAGSLQDEAVQPLSNEVVAALWSVAYGVAAGPIRTFVTASSGLHWSNHRLTSVAQRYARSLHELATLPLPNLCADVRAFRQSGFHVAPASAIHADEHAEGIALNPISQRLLAPFERGSDASIVARTKRLEEKLEAREFSVGFDDWEKILKTLGLNF